MLLLDILVVLLVLFLLALLVIAVVSAYSILPLSDLLNSLLRRIGLAGPSPSSRSIGGHVVGTVDSPFSVDPGQAWATGKISVKGELWNAVCEPALANELAEGDVVEIVYNDDLTVTVARKADRPA